MTLWGQGTLFKIQIKWACTFLYVICLYTLKVCLSLNRNWFMFPTRKSLLFLLKTDFPDFFFWEHVLNRLIICIIISYISTCMHIYCSYLHLTLDVVNYWWPIYFLLHHTSVTDHSALLLMTNNTVRSDPVIELEPFNVT